MTTSALLFDAAYAPDLAAVKAAGGIAMSVYLTGRYADTCAQPSALHAEGLGALGNYEQDPQELMYCGRTGGVTIGRRSADAYIAKGAPAKQGLGIAYSLDANCPPSSFGVVAEALDGVKEGLAGRFVPFLYGEGAAIDYMVQHLGLVAVNWLAAPTSWPGFQPNDPRVAMVQQVGSPVRGTDEDVITALGALRPLIWWPPGSPYANGVMVNMALAPEVQAEFDKVLAAVAGVRELFRTTEPDGKTVVTGTAERIDELHVEQPLAALLTAVSAKLDALSLKVDALAAPPGTAGNDVTKGES